MNWDIIEGKWTQFKGSVKERWGDFTDDEIDMMEGKKDRLVGKLQERYGYTRDEADRAADEWSAGLDAEGRRAA